MVWSGRRAHGNGGSRTSGYLCIGMSYCTNRGMYVQRSNTSLSRGKQMQAGTKERNQRKIGIIRDESKKESQIGM